MTFGDKIPYKSVEVLRGVGNAANAAVAANRIGFHSALMAITGEDEEGVRTMDHFQKEGIDTDFITSQKDIPTNYHYVLRYGAERTILVKHEHYDYHLDTEKLDGYDIGWVYLTSIASGTEKYHDEIIDWLEKNPQIKMAFQPGTFQIKSGVEKMKRVYEHSEIFFCNVEEAQKILGTDSRDVKELMKKMHELGPKIISITDGPAGAYAYDSYHDEYWFHPIYPDPQPPVERTGAGDSFSSTFAVAIAQGKTVAEALSWGPINSMNVVQHIGAQAGLLTKEKLEEYLTNAPEHYKPEQI
jgi:ribokinase